MNEAFNIQQLTQFEFGAILLTVLAAGLVIGCVIAYGILNRKHGPDTAQAREIQREFDDYKEKVDDHFNQTSEMFMDVTTQYKKLYDHMAVGAVDLCDADISSMPRLEMQEAGNDAGNAAEPEDIPQTNRPPDYAEDDEKASELKG